jgi:quinoprotein glucose dehydrogenase
MPDNRVRTFRRPLSPLIPTLAVGISLTGPWAFGLDSGKVVRQQAEGVDPITHPASDLAAKAAPAISLPKGWKLDLYAAEPLLSDPVAMNFDERGRLYIALHHRNRYGTQDTREHRYWREDDQAVRTMEDRLSFMHKWAEAGKVPMSYYTHLPDRLVCIEDRNGDGVADISRELAKFQEPLDGANAGVLVRNGEVWVTCIPNLWHFKDDGGENLKGKKVLTGFGTKFTFHGHDMHGVLFGPDGRLYWSIGDRGYHVTDLEGRVHESADSGAVFRCEPDGSNMEVYATGLRNPQEIVFDDLGNLITVDNDNDAEDDPRLLHVLQGGDYGWRNGNLWKNESLPTYSPDFRRPWYEDLVYQKQHPNQPAYVQPALGFITSGPCGLTREPGTSLMPDEWRGGYLITDWRGGRSNSPVIGFHLKAEGMNFSIERQEDLIKGTLPTDVTFGPDGRLYVSDMVESRKQPNGGVRGGRGWVWAITPPVSDERKKAAQELKGWFASGFTNESNETLIQRLGHEDQRVRMEAQFVLAERGDKSLPLLLETALKENQLLARVHALQALGQIQRRTGKVNDGLLPLLEDANPEMRTQIARYCTDTPLPGADAELQKLLFDPNDRCAYHAAQAVGRLSKQENIPLLARFLSERVGDDPSLRLAGIAALERLSSQDGAKEQILKLAASDSAHLRLALTVLFRRNHWQEVERFLNDADAKVVREAVRAIHDAPIDNAMPALARMTDKLPVLDQESARRVLNANYRLGSAEHAKTIAKAATAQAVPLQIRLDALAMLDQWAEPTPTDRVTGSWRPISPRSQDPARAALKDIVDGIIHDPHAEVASAAVSIAGKFGMNEVIGGVIAMAKNGTLPASQRASALRALVMLPGDDALNIAKELLNSPDEPIRIACRATLAKLEPSIGLDPLKEALTKGSVSEQRESIRTLGSLQNAAATEALRECSDRLVSGNLPASLALDLDQAMEARTKLPTDYAKGSGEALAAFRKHWLELFPANDPLRDYRMTLEGGNFKEGRRLFHEVTELQCLRCHRIEHAGVSNVGPDLSGISKQRNREYLLRSIVDPAADIAPGFEFANLTLHDGSTVAGLIESETKDTIVIKGDAEHPGATVEKSRIKERQSVSAMPPLVSLMSKSQLRDLIEYISTQK